MNKKAVVEHLVRDAAMGRKDAALALESLLAAVKESLATRGKATVSGFGVFERRDRPARVARNPRTGQLVATPARSATVFRPGKTLRERVAGDSPSAGSVPDRAGEAPNTHA